MEVTAPLPLVSVIVVNWNGRHHLAECLDSLAAQSYRNFEVVLVDNGSVDGSVDYVRREYPWVKLVPLTDNSGFAEGNNQGLTHSAGDYLVTLNNDTWVDPFWLQGLVSVADAHPEVGMVGCRVCTYIDPERLDSLGVRICADGMSRGALRGARFSALGCPVVVPILLPSACAALYKRTMVERIGFFDSDFFAYCEDTDLGLRGRLAGWGALLATEAVVWHKYSQTGGALSPFKLRLVERNHYWVVLKTFPLPLLALAPFMTIGRFFYQGLAFLRGSWRQCGGTKNQGAKPTALIGALLQGIWEALAGTPLMLARRRSFQPERRLSTVQVWKLFRQYRLSFRELFEEADI